MNYQDPGMDGTSRAELEYLDGEYRVIRAGHFVLCEVTGKRIPLEELRYWNVDRQEAYYDAAAVQERRKQLGLA